MNAVHAPPVDTIFVQMASYRDSQLIPTLRNLIAQARNPKLLRIVVCWQHASDETLAGFWQQGFGKWRVEKGDPWNVHHLTFRDAKIELIDVPHMQTQGACWARNLIQQRYAGERYTLQLDSHHRFIREWDRCAIGMLDCLRDRSAKPVLTTYLPMFEPNADVSQLTGEPAMMVMFRFSLEGVVMFRPQTIPEWRSLDRPVPARFYSGHFALADGHFAKVVQHDPEYFFLGEEISITVRAFTHGYDLYHPHRVIAWHEYTRSHRVKVWDDHTPDARDNGHISQHWGERNDRAYRRNRELFGIDGTTTADDLYGRYGFGTERTVADYEAYAGISFAYRGVRQATLDHRPPIPDAVRPESDEDWRASLLRANDVRVCVHRNLFAGEALTATAEAEALPLLSAAAAVVIVGDTFDEVLYRETLDAERLAKKQKDGWLDFHVVFESSLERIPAWYVVELFDDAGEMSSRVRQQITI